MWNKKIIFIFIFFLFIFIAFLYKQTLVSNFKLDIPSGSCIDQRKLEKDIISNNKSYYLMDLNKLSDDLKFEYPCIKDIHFNFSILQGFNIKIDKRVPLARVIPSSSIHDLSLDSLEASASTTSALLDWSFNESTISADYLIVDSEGVVFERKDENYLPLIFINDEGLKIGTALSKVFFKNIENILSKLNNLVNFNESKVIGGYFLVNGVPKVIFDLGGDVNHQIISLQLILNKARMDNNEIESIDLRFKNPVIKYSNKKLKKDQS